MATSNSTNFIVTRDDIITEALELLGVLGEGEVPTSDQLSSSSRTLNMLVKTFQADGLNLFATQRVGLLIVPGQQKYGLSSTTTEHIGSDFNVSELTSAYSATATQIVIDTTSINNYDTALSSNYAGYSVVVEGDDEVLWSANVTSATSGSGTITLDLDGFGSSDAAIGNNVALYKPITSKRPMGIVEAYYKQPNGSFIPCKILSRKEYNTLSTRNTTGQINQVYYDPQTPTGDLYVWPTGTTSTFTYLELIIQRTLEDFDSGSDNPDFPQEWYMPLAYNLAYYLAPKYGTPQLDYQRLMIYARDLYQKAREYDTEMYSSVYFGPNKNGDYV